MKTREISQSEWREFFDEFSRSHKEITASVQVIGEDIGSQTEAIGLPLVGISAEDSGSEKNSIALILGNNPDDHLDHRICNPTHVWLKAADRSLGDVLEIEAADGAKTLVQFDPVTR